MLKINMQLMFVLAITIVFLPSCSQIRQITTSSYHKLHLIKDNGSTTAITKVESHNVIEKKGLNPMPSTDHEISTLHEEKNSTPQIHPVKFPIIHPFITKESKTDPRTELKNKNLERVDNALDRLDKINTTSASSNTKKKLLPRGRYDHNRVLWLWISALVLDIIFWALFAVTLAVFFGALSFLFGVAALIFFIVWLVQLYS